MISIKTKMLPFLFLILTTIGLRAQTAELEFDFDIPAVKEDESRVLYFGSIEGEAIEEVWDFQPYKGVITNGAMGVQISSSRSASVSIWLTTDLGGTVYQKQNQWYLRITLGNLVPGDTLFNSKETFAIPAGPYSMITLRKGPEGTEYRHREYTQNNRMSAFITKSEYLADGTLRLEGALRSEWGENWLQVEFSVLIGGPDDRNGKSNRSGMKYSFQ